MDLKEDRLDETLDFSLLFDMEKIQKIQDAFSDATGVASIITDVNGIPLTQPSNFCRLCNLIRSTEKGLDSCIKSDSYLGRQNREGVILKPCLSGGLWDGGTSINVGGVHIANWLIGQVRDPEMDLKELLSNASHIGVDKEEYESAMKEVTVMSPARFEQICQFLFLMANQLSELAYNNIMQNKANREKEELQEKLSQKNKMDAIGQLTGGIAHDFNNMLGGIMGAAHCLKNSAGRLEKEGEAYLDLIIEASERAADLTGKLLTFSRKENRRFKVIDVHEIIEATIAILERSIDRKISLSFKANAIDHVVNGNISDLQNSFLNLGINSSHAIEKNEGSLVITTSNVAVDKNYSEKNHLVLEAGEYLKISFKDNGCGIPRENLNRIFEPFFTTKNRGRGTGLGLSTVYGVIENHKGNISVHSEVNTGTEFLIYLPLAKGESEQEIKEVSSAIRKGKGLIYLFDDEDIILTTSAAIIRRLGYRVKTFKNPQEGIDSFKKEYASVDLVITDMIMAECSGKDVFYRLKKIDFQCNVILSSGNIQEDDLNRLLQDGLSGYIAKPYSDREISHLIRNTIFNVPNY